MHGAIERCLERQMTKLETVELLARLGVAPKFTMLGEPRAAAFPPQRRPYPGRRALLRRARYPPAAP